MILHGIKRRSIRHVCVVWLRARCYQPRRSGYEILQKWDRLPTLANQSDSFHNNAADSFAKSTFNLHINITSRGFFTNRVCWLMRPLLWENVWFSAEESCGSRGQLWPEMGIVFQINSISEVLKENKLVKCELNLSRLTELSAFRLLA